MLKNPLLNRLCADLQHGVLRMPESICQKLRFFFLRMYGESCSKHADLFSSRVHGVSTRFKNL